MRLQPPSPRQRVLDRAVIVVKKAARNRGILVVNAEAELIFGKYPNCPMSLAEVQNEITLLALQDHVTLQLG